MKIDDLLNDKGLKPKEKTETLANWVVENIVSTDEVLAFASKAKESPKATCIEAFEFATRKDLLIANEHLLKFVSEALTDKAPRVKWESAKVIGNIAQLFPKKLDLAITNLLANAEHSGTVVRWSAAFALGEIIKLKTKHNVNLIPAIESICKREEKNSIKKMYLAALKKMN